MDSPADLVEALAAAAVRWPDRVAWRFDPGETLTFGQVAERTAAYAGCLASKGVRPGDRVVVMMGNQADFPLTWFALMRLGAVMVPVNAKYRTTDADHVVSLSGATIAVVADRAAAGVLGADLTIVTVEELQSGVASVVAEDISSRTTVNVQMTSGTTGRPKGCVLSHDYWLTVGVGMLEEFPYLTETDILLTAQPFSYIDPQWNVVAALLSGAELVVLEGFHPSTFWSKVRRYDVTYFYCLGAMPTLLLRMPVDPMDREHKVRAIQCSAIPPMLHADLERRWGVPWFETFGMTETGADIRVRATDHDAMVGTGVIGHPTSYREASLAPDDELLLRGRGMMDGYLNNHEATAAAFAGGWFHTGDLASIDDCGAIRLVGRKKDMIRRSGENIAAREVEDVLQSHPAVSLAAVVAVSDDLRGEEGHAYVVIADADLDTLIAYTEGRLAPFKVPRYWSLHTDLPRTPSERVEKRRLVDLEAAVFDRAEKKWLT